MEELKEFKYEVGGKVYFQRKLVLGQISQLVSLIKDISLPEEITVLSIVSTLGDKLTKAVAIVLIPEDIPHLKNKNLQKVIEDIEFEMSPELALEVVENFFDCNQISLLLNRIGEMVKKAGKEENKEMEKKAD